ncbi:cupin domain-containing protein [Streptomyces bathyalis]|uniref:Cupin domain-containing protein n=1 Tax=Streptomyces bathyalis TaxID=2710756 RepID=A0A7T1T7K4_9ACTN|nr:quercetin 2,3-dioxygenase [Streptomyces bathyalis]QPP07846.1 cupin domain-containing protein [Streptomyces bathyalis]
MNPPPQESAQPQEHAQPLWLNDNLVYVHVGGEQSGGAYSLSETLGARGNMPPLHVHRRNEETFYVLEGEVRLFLGDREVVLTAGRAALAPRGVPHTYRVESERARWLVINSPAGYEEFLRATAEPAPRAELPPAGRRSDPAALAGAAAEQGIDILGPPGTLPTQL